MTHFLNSIRVDKNIKPIHQLSKFIDKINDHTKSEPIDDFINSLSEKTDIPKQIIAMEYKQFISRNHNFALGKFDRIFKFHKIFADIGLYYLTFLYIFIFSKNNKKLYKKVDIIFDEIVEKDDYEFVKPLSEKFSSYKLIVSEDMNISNQIISYKRQGYDRQILFANVKKIFYEIIISTMKYSMKCKSNLIPFAIHVLKNKLKYETIFSLQKSDFLFQNRYYTTSSIKNFLFKKYGGKICSCHQRILIHLGKVGHFIDTDIFFSFGKKSAEILNLNGSKFKKIVPVGSQAFETYWLNVKKLKTPVFDIIFLGGNQLQQFNTDKKYLINYYKQIQWICDLSKKYPNLKIAFKHHQSLKIDDKKELEMLKKTSIKRIVKTEQGYLNQSYGYAINAKVRLTWCSTMAYELLGHNIHCYFLDPKMENESFLHNYEYNKFWRLDTYEKFENKIKDILENNRIDEIKNSENFCIKSEGFSERVSNNLKENLVNPL